MSKWVIKRYGFFLLNAHNKSGDGSLLVLLKNMTTCLKFCLDLYNA